MSFYDSDPFNSSSAFPDIGDLFPQLQSYYSIAENPEAYCFDPNPQPVYVKPGPIQGAPHDVAITIAKNLDGQSLHSVSMVWRKMYEALQSGQNSGEQIKLALFKLLMLRGNYVPTIWRQTPRLMLEALKDYRTRWAYLQFRDKGVVGIPNSSRSMGRGNPKLDFTQYYRGESGGCVYVVQGDPGPGWAISPGNWTVTVFQFPSSRCSRDKVARYQAQMQFHPTGVAVDTSQDLLMVFESGITARRGSFIHLYQLSTGTRIQSPFHIKCNTKCTIYVDKAQIVGDVVGFLVKYVNHNGSDITGRMWEEDILENPSPLFFFNWRKGILSSMLPQVSDIHATGFQFVDHKTVLVLEVMPCNGRRYCLRVISLPFGCNREQPEVDIEIPLPDPYLTGLKFIPNITPFDSRFACATSPFYDNPDERLVGFSHSHGILLATLGSLKRRERSSLHQMSIYGHHFALSGRRLLWGESRSATSERVTFKIQDFTPAALMTYLPNGQPVHSEHPVERGWSTVSKRASGIPNARGKTFPSMYTYTAKVPDVIDFFFTEDNIVVITGGETVGKPLYGLAIKHLNF